MQKRYQYILLPSLLLALFLTGCNKQNHFTIPAVIIQESANADHNISQQNKWWSNFNDPTLNNLIELALTQNLSLLATSQRVEQAYSQLSVTNAGLYPSIDANINRQTNRIISQSDDESKSYRASLNLNYAIDLWGKTKSLVKSRQFSYLAQYQSYRFAAFSTAKEVANLYISLGSFVEKRALLQEQLKIAQDIHKALDFRFSYGKTEYANILEQERQIKILQSLIASNETNIKVTQKALAMLIGVSPTQGLDIYPTLPKKGALPLSGFNASLVQKRADVQAAYHTLESQNQNAAAAILSRYPNITISLGLGSDALSSSGLFENWLLNTLGSIVAPVFQGGAIDAEVKRTKSATQEAAYLYADTFMKALYDIEQSLLKERELHTLLKNKEEQIKLLQARIERIQDAYDNGTLSYIEFIGIIQTWQNLKQEYIATKEAYLKSQVNLYFSLGSNWQPTQEIR